MMVLNYNQLYMIKFAMNKSKIYDFVLWIIKYVLLKKLEKIYEQF